MVITMQTMKNQGRMKRYVHIEKCPEKQAGQKPEIF
jgi:hypothetical protein